MFTLLEAALVNLTIGEQGSLAFKQALFKTSVVLTAVRISVLACAVK